MDSFVSRDEKILLKPNLLAADPPDKCTTTHPAVFTAVAGLVLETGARVSFGDSPAVGSTAGAARKSGLLEAARELDIPMADFKEGVEADYPEGRQNKRFVIARAVMESDGLVSLPKLKTHGFEKYTGAVKNQFGCIPGVLKGEFHVKLPDAGDFARMLLDLNAFVKPRLYIMDGIMAMEGNGPRGGKVKPMHVLLFSVDAVALDATACRIIGVNPRYVPTVQIGHDLGYGTAGEDAVEILGDDITSFVDNTFDIDRDPLKPFRAAGIMKFFRNRIVPKPVIDESRCVRCGICIDMCPAQPKAVNWDRGDKSCAPVYSYASCIRCYCCQELCPESAITLKKPMVRKLFSRS
jgi:uncharacterized protein (DUF362 family)/Pyruvate/2-oxoacid:ferredoxin oxidoreductase delta subunit